MRARARRARIWRLRAALIVSVAVVVVGVAVLIASNPTPRDREPRNILEKSNHALAWRVGLLTRKVLGRLPDLSWPEFLELTRPGGDFGRMAAGVVAGRSLDAIVVNPYASPDDLKAGKRTFLDRCAVCHDESGQRAPQLSRKKLRHGDSDFAIYKAVRDGVPDTAMAPVPMTFRERWQVVGYLRSLQQSASGEAEPAPRAALNITDDDLRAAGENPEVWLTYSGSLAGSRYSHLTELSPQTVSGLRLRWTHQFKTEELNTQATPLVAGGTIFISEPPASVVAIDAKTGEVIWRTERMVPDGIRGCCGKVTRGLAVAGNTVFMGAFDAHLVAIDAGTGKVIWDVEVAKSEENYTMTGAPLAANGSVFVGVAGGDFGSRGFVAAYDAATGKQKWRFNTVPGPGEAGHETWENDAWRTGGAATWITGSYDPSLDIVYWGVGNPAPIFDKAARPGDNLYANSVVAIHASTGKLAWHFQFTPSDEHDWDANQTPVLANLPIGGVERKVICWANRNGFYYLLDRVTGEFLLGRPFVEQNWASGLDPKGRPILTDEGKVSVRGSFTKPGFDGATTWQNSAYDRVKGLIFVPATENASIYTKSGVRQRHHDGSRVLAGSGAVASERNVGYVRALNVATGERKWQYLAPPIRAFGYGGLLATGGGLLFGASGGVLFALDSATGAEVWRVALGGASRAAPISFALDGRQVVAVAVGRALYLFGL